MSQWSGIETGKLRVRRWASPGEAVVFRCDSGDTHLLDPLQAELLSKLNHGTYSAPELLDSLEDLLEFDRREAALEYIEAALLKLRNLGLVSSLPL